MNRKQDRDKPSRCSKMDKKLKDSDDGGDSKPRLDSEEGVAAGGMLRSSGCYQRPRASTKRTWGRNDLARLARPIRAKQSRSKEGLVESGR